MKNLSYKSLILIAIILASFSSITLIVAISIYENQQNLTGGNGTSELTPIYIDIKPGSWPNPINPISKGKVPIAICGTDDLDVTDIDPASVLITMEGVSEWVSPLRWSFEDVATPFIGEIGFGHNLIGDGNIDLVLHFENQELVNSLDLTAYLGETVLLKISGILNNDGTTIVGYDYIHVLGKEKDGLVITIDRSHDTAENYTVWDLASFLTLKGNLVYILDHTFSIPEGTNVLLITAARTRYTEDELNMIKTWFYDDGHRLLWISGDCDYWGWANYFTPDACNEILESVDSNLRLSNDTVEDYVYNYGTYHYVAVTTPLSDGKINSILTNQVENTFFHGPTSVLGYKDEVIIDLRESSIKNVEVIMQSSENATYHNWDATDTEFDYYSKNNINGSYPMIVLEEKKLKNDQNYIIVSGDSIFSDYEHMYGTFAGWGNYNNGFHDGKILVDNIFKWFRDLSG
ncbi:MAG: hypothetical protein ACXAC6_18100 [Candidatus Hodarchaeales archaeon]|jgi:hypothetical protein